MNSTFPKLDISQFLNTPIQCNFHHNGAVDAICSFPSCEGPKMLCPECRLKNPDHVNAHKGYFKRPDDLKKTLMNENDEFHKLVAESIINASETLKSNVDTIMKTECEKLLKLFEELMSRLKNELENLRIEIVSQIIKKYFSEILSEFEDFYSPKFAKFNESILTPFLNYDRIAKNKIPMTSRQFETAVNEIFNARIVTIQFNNLKDEKVKSLIQNIPKFDTPVFLDETLKKINGLLMNSFKVLYYPSLSPSPAKSPLSHGFFPPRSPGIGFLKRGSTFDMMREEKEEMEEDSEELSNKLACENLAEAHRILLSKTLPMNDLEISVSLPITERQDKEMEILGRALRKSAESGRKFRRLDIDCASKAQARRSVNGGITDDGIELFAQGLTSLSGSLEIRNSGISDIGLKSLISSIIGFQSLRTLNLEFYMDMKITDKTLEELTRLKKLGKVEEILINFTKYPSFPVFSVKAGGIRTKVSKESAERMVLELRGIAGVKKVEIFANL